MVPAEMMMSFCSPFLERSLASSWFRLLRASASSWVNCPAEPTERTWRVWLSAEGGVRTSDTGASTSVFCDWTKEKIQFGAYYTM